MQSQVRGDPRELAFVEMASGAHPRELRVRVWTSEALSSRQMEELRALFDAWRRVGGWYGFGDGGRTNYVHRFDMQPEPARPVLDAVFDMQGGNDLAVNVLLWSLDGARRFGFPIARVRIGDD